MNKKTIWITGGSTGIGKALAIKFASMGWNVAISARREGLLKNKKAYLVITSGGTKLNSEEDFLTPWLKFILNFFGIEKVDIISADQMALDYEKSISDAEEQIEKLFKD